MRISIKATKTACSKIIQNREEHCITTATAKNWPSSKKAKLRTTWLGIGLRNLVLSCNSITEKLFTKMRIVIDREKRFETLV